MDYGGGIGKNGQNLYNQNCISKLNHANKY